ncbi:MAG TPA: 16S rRNA (guanine(527)-N(7))-methyltransferase RsmG [Allosphingosinicella sp.]
MEEAEAKDLLDVPRETLERLESFEALLRKENERQNLVSRSSLEMLWSRHILDSAQITRFAPVEASKWLDLGTGAGFPGLIVPLVSKAHVTLVESRRLRTDFLQRAAAVLGIEAWVEIICARLETAEARRFDVISARAFAPLDKLLSLAHRFSTEKTVWILPKGRNAQSELDAARSSWQGDFRLEPSLTDPDARIIVASRVRRKPRGR